MTNTKDPKSIGDLSAEIVGALSESMAMDQAENTDRKQVAELSFVPEPSFAVIPGYSPLARVLEDAFDQAATGKGKRRHANGKPFARQPIMEIWRMVGMGYQTGQAMKKAQEATNMLARGESAAAEAELLGAINYLAAAIMLIRETR